jgi:hypothetical protein
MSRHPPSKRPRGSVSLADVRAEGVREVGRVSGTSVMFIRTDRGLRLVHADHTPVYVPIDRVRELLRVGWSSYEVAAMYDVSESTVREMLGESVRAVRGVP